MTGHIQVLFVK